MWLVVCQATIGGPPFECLSHMKTSVPKNMSCANVPIERGLCMISSERFIQESWLIVKKGRNVLSNQ